MDHHTAARAAGLFVGIGQTQHAHNHVIGCHGEQHMLADPTLKWEQSG